MQPGNKDFTWANNQDKVIRTKIDRIFASTEWDPAYPLSRVKTLAKGVSDHTVLFLDLGENMVFGKKSFRFEKW